MEEGGAVGVGGFVALGRLGIRQSGEEPRAGMDGVCWSYNETHPISSAAIGSWARSKLIGDERKRSQATLYQQGVYFFLM